MAGSETINPVATMALHVLIVILASSSSFPAQAQGQEHTNIYSCPKARRTGRQMMGVACL